jgi:DNA-binding beta-propeller fold protein YncE
VLAGAAMVVTATAAVLTIGLTQDSGTASPAVVAASNSVGLFDPDTRRLVADLPLGGSAHQGLGQFQHVPNIGIGLGSVWVCNAEDGTVLRIDPRRRAVVRTIGLGATPAAIAVGRGAVWVLTSPTKEVIKLDALGNVDQRIALPRPKVPPPSPEWGSASIASGRDAVWVVHGLASVAKIDARSGRVVRNREDLGGILPGAVVATRNAVWITGLDQALAVRLDPRTAAPVAKTPAAGGPLAFWFAIAKGLGGLWVSDLAGDVVWRIDPLVNRTAGSVSVDHYPIGIAAHGGSLWVAASLAKSIDEVDPATMRVVSRTDLGANPSDIVSGPGDLWITFGG